MRLRVRGKGRRRGAMSARRARLQESWPWVRYVFGRFLQVLGLVVTLVGATAFFGTPSTTAMLNMMLAGVLIFLPGWWLARKDPRGAGRAG